MAQYETTPSDPAQQIAGGKALELELSEDSEEEEVWIPLMTETEGKGLLLEDSPDEEEEELERRRDLLGSVGQSGMHCAMLSEMAKPAFISAWLASRHEPVGGQTNPCRLLLLELVGAGGTLQYFTH